MRQLVGLSIVAAVVCVTAADTDAFCRQTEDNGSVWEPIPAGDIPVYYQADLGDVSPDITLDVAVDQLRLAIRMWNEQAPSSSRFRLVAETSLDNIPGAVIVRLEGTKLVGSGPLRQPICDVPGPTTLGCLSLTSGQLVARPVADGATMWIRKFDDMWFMNPSGTADGRRSLASVITHELGHLLTLGHPSDCASRAPTVMEPGRNGFVARLHRDDVNAVRSVYPTAGFVLQDIHYSSTGASGTWQRDIPSLDAPALPLFSVSNTTPTLATRGDRRVLAFPSIFPAGDLVGVLPGQGDSWSAFAFVTTDPTGVSHAPVGVAVVDDTIVVVWHHESDTAGGLAGLSRGLYAVSTDFGSSFSAPSPLLVRDNDANADLPFDTRSTSGYSVDYAESVQTFFVLGTTEHGAIVQWAIPNATLTASIGTQLSIASQQRPTLVCGHDGRRLEPVPGFPLAMECAIGMGGSGPYQTLTYFPVAVVSASGTTPDRLLGPSVFETNLRIEYSPSLLWRTDAVSSPLWLGTTHSGHSNVSMFNHSEDTTDSDSWTAAAIVPVSSTGVARPLTAVGMGLTQAGGDDVLQFVSGELFP